jgi:hypothetical protein
MDRSGSSGCSACRLTISCRMRSGRPLTDGCYVRSARDDEPSPHFGQILTSKLPYFDQKYHLASVCAHFEQCIILSPAEQLTPHLSPEMRQRLRYCADKDRPSPLISQLCCFTARASEPIHPKDLNQFQLPNPAGTSSTG